MDPSINKYASVALVGLVMLFPIFNEVAQTSLDALYNADHQAKLDELFKSWDDIPEDEKLAYWDGKSKPPGGQDGDFDRDDLDDDFKSKEGEPAPGDRDGDGVPDEEDPDPDDPDVKDEEDVQRYERRREVLWSFEGTDTPANDDGERIVLSRTYTQINLTSRWEGFSGTARFTLEDDGGTQVEEVRAGNSNVPVFDDDRSYTEQKTSLSDHGDDLVMVYDYEPLAKTPDDFEITVIGDYLVPVDGDADEDDPEDQDDEDEQDDDEDRDR